MIQYNTTWLLDKEMYGKPIQRLGPLCKIHDIVCMYFILHAMPIWLYKSQLDFWMLFGIEINMYWELYTDNDLRYH